MCLQDKIYLPSQKVTYTGRALKTQKHCLKKKKVFTFLYVSIQYPYYSDVEANSQQVNSESGGGHCYVGKEGKMREIINLGKKKNLIQRDLQQNCDHKTRIWNDYSSEIFLNSSVKPTKERKQKKTKVELQGFG